MKRAFWRGMITGSIIGALLSMMKRPQRKFTGIPGLRNNLRRMYSRHATGRVIRGMSRTVDGIIKKRYK
ncbi:hypothetical protein IT084_04140 [Desulfallas sp. Bu1-1]|uniref:hypothetical protein n=1 Tax=Desulfallas sp. Bu1-1 TaxID=2787620 RepID=UPI0018A0943E|nr:hypothetical protein [Desulfallas sp. Bu1-1]MBF7082167.1 hypothetical protein [Desulfallas sp. Bu1-1]